MYRPEATILHPGDNKSRLPGSSLRLLIRNHLRQVGQGSLKSETLYTNFMHNKYVVSQQKYSQAKRKEEMMGLTISAA